MNRGDPQNGCDTDQFPNDVGEMAVAVYQLLKNGGFTSGGFNFDAKVRRQSLDIEDLFNAHIGGVDVLARALLAAESVIEDGTLDLFVANRYAACDEEFGRTIMTGNATLEDASNHALLCGLDPKPQSGRQEYLENLINRFV